MLRPPSVPTRYEAWINSVAPPWDTITLTASDSCVKPITSQLNSTSPPNWRSLSNRISSVRHCGTNQKPGYGMPGPEGMSVPSISTRVRSATTSRPA
ncbi:Uncharacterised protein [Mycobacteroides abscessus subsp. abscessus]|nr:Uncharacterised protein [Mycobacteroides abscessus subsp. abscessus]